jgi:hypothetical protein
VGAGRLAMEREEEGCGMTMVEKMNVLGGRTE